MEHYTLTYFLNNYKDLTKKSVFKDAALIQIRDEKGEILVDSKEHQTRKKSVASFYPDFLKYLSEKYKKYISDFEMLNIIDRTSESFKKTEKEAIGTSEGAYTIYSIEIGKEKRYWKGTNSTVGMKLMAQVLEKMKEKNIPQFNEDLDKLFVYFEKDGADDKEQEIKKEENEESTSMELRSAEEIIKTAIEKNKQVIFTGAPGTGKTYTVRKIVNEKVSGNKDDYKFVQFHSSYDYSDFVEGLRPVVLLGQTEPTFVRMDGTFKAFCRHVVEENKKNGNEEKEYYFIVDEINRGDLSKVFGELMFGLEESYRREENAFDTQYKNLKTYRILESADKGSQICGQVITDTDLGHAVPVENDVFEKGFYIPENLHFIGTMNDIDRSVDSMDFALRRRFMWMDIKANEIMESSMADMYADEDEDIRAEINAFSKRIIKMNEVMTSEKFRKLGLTEAYHIGPAYFKNLNTESVKDMQDSEKEIFEHNVVSILREYLRGRREKEVKDLIDSCKKELLPLQGEN